ncbi:MAG: ATP-binding cassette domain-containing protein, partial [Clostridium perfringens]|nr:ATP-binding cassette domain-containing protein [Clostridium perfringens]
MIIQCKDIKKTFKVGDTSVEILKGISLEINKGEFTAVIGESGSGKSTFLNILGGIMPCDEGEIVINEHHIEGLNENELALFRRKNMGFIFQSYNLMPQLTALENVEMPLIFSGV